MKVLDRYLVRQFLAGAVLVALLLQILFGFMRLAEELEDVGQGAYTTFDALRVVLYTAPQRIIDLMPVTMMLGGLLGLGAMASHHELMAARAMGMSRQRIARPVLLLGILIAAGMLAAQSLLVPPAERAASDVRARTLADTGVGEGQGGTTEFWTRSGDRFVRVNEVRFGQLLTDIEVYTLDRHGRLQQLLQAATAVVRGADDWRLSDVTVTHLEGDISRDERFTRLDWPGLLSRDQAEVLMLPLETLAPRDLLGLIAVQRDNGLDTHAYRVVLWQQFATPVAVVGMALLALPLLLGSVRVLSAGSRIVIGGFVGIVFYLIQQLAGHLSGLFSLSPFGFIMTPSIALLGAAVYLQFLDQPGRRRRRQKRAAASHGGTGT